jgi:hypothetical protein
VFICGNVFNFSTTKNNKKIKNLYTLYMFLKKYNFKNYLSLNSIILDKTKFDVVILFLFLFYFNKTKNIIKLSQTHNINNYYFSEKQSFIKNFICKKANFVGVFNKYSKLYITNNYTLYLFLQDNKIKTTINVNNNLSVPKSTNSSIYKNISLFDYSNIEFQFLRKNKVYNKGRYSRCRQNYRTGVYLCMYLSVVSIFGLYYWFFKFSFNFSYLW